MLQKINGESVGEAMEKRKPLCTIAGNVNQYGHYGKEYRDSSEA